MHIRSFRIRNYKSFSESEKRTLELGFNVIIGQNNAGKTALIEALSLFPNGAKPHKNSRQPVGYPIDGNSYIDLDVFLSADDISRIIKSAGQFRIAVPSGTNQENAKNVLSNLLYKDGIFTLTCSHNKIWSSEYPAHRLFEKNSESMRAAIFQWSVTDSNFRFFGMESRGDDDIPAIFGRYIDSSIYSFRAERVALGSCGVGANSKLNPNAQNLAEVLGVLQSQPFMFEKYNSLVRDIFPNIRRVSVSPQPNNVVEIKIWNTAAPPDREDLAQPLSESGTGLGQVLAILYIILTSRRSQTIISRP